MNVKRLSLLSLFIIIFSLNVTDASTKPVRKYKAKSLYSWKNDPSVSRARRYYVSVEVKSGGIIFSGTGIIMQTGLVLTNYHIITCLDKLIKVEDKVASQCTEGISFTPEFVDEEMLDSSSTEISVLEDYKITVNGHLARIVSKDATKDLLLLSVYTTKVPINEMRNYVELEEPVFCIGNPMGKDDGYHSGGAILMTGEHGILSSVFAKPGFSGSGLYSA